jgi:hypothetical protein
MKKLLVLLSLPVLFYLNSCKEIGPKIEITPIDTTFTAIDTTYIITSIPAAESRRVLIEEATGVQCPNCPDGAVILKTLENSNKEPGDTSKSRVLVVGLHALSFTDPIHSGSFNSKYDFRNDKAKDLIQGPFGGDPSKPSAVIDRIPNSNGQYFVFRSTWQNVVTQRLSVIPPVNLSVTSEMSDTNKAIITVKATYTQNVAKDQNLSIYIVEDKIVDVQEYTGFFDSMYVHNHVMRDMVTPTAGLSFLDSLSNKEPGRVYVRSYKYTINPAWKKENCKVIAVIHNDEQNDIAVMQAAETKLKP